ncbi:hypothetical protein [Aurantimonas sp. VKM B-3413]|uniref:hypothetical protein n=1 Tax=Aurantimonas sp. VKM B-3413 TaxID=2779401 RepID=UPI001E63811D|nr:hypothetical protein [Aurantimonas sp. VKM B-3413]MCB8839710.1 hypothetical protein [Aurantimonas sp. VKM B-3413]
MAGPLEVFIHAGMHKTGTTSVQAALAAHRGALLDSGIWYPPGGPKQIAPLINPKRADWREDHTRSVLGMARQADATRVLLSLESVSTFTGQQFRRLTDCFSDCDLTYVFVFRHWSSYLPSRWKQYVGRRDSQTFAGYVNAALGSDHIDNRFDLVLDRAAGSGRCSVKAISHDWAVRDEGGVLPAVLRAVEVDGVLQSSLLSGAGWLHRSAGGEDFEVARLLNGLLAHRMGLPQDDNFRSVAEGRPCDVFFDASASDMPEALASRIVSLGRTTALAHAIPAEWNHALDGLEGHRSLFPDLGERPVFPREPRQATSCWALEWQDLREWSELQEVIDEMAPRIAERLGRRRTLVS